jgi:diguanylate cyclase (GGDEF)-like protein
MKSIFDSLRNRLMTLFIVSVLVVGIPTYLYIDNIYTQRSVSEKGVRIHTLAQTAAIMMSEALRERQREIALLAESSLIKRGDYKDPEILQMLNRVKTTYKHYSWIGLADVTGQVQVATDGLLKGASVIQRPWFQQGLHRPYVGDLHEALLLSELLPKRADNEVIRFIDFAAPVKAADGTMRGVLAAHAQWDWAEDVVNIALPEASRNAGFELFIVNHEGRLIYPQGPTMMQPLPAHLMHDEPFVVDHWDDGVQYGIGTHLMSEPIAGEPLGWRMIVRRPLALIKQDVQVLKQTLLLFKFFAILLLVGLIWWVASRMSRPIEKIAQFARQVQQGDESAQLSIADRASEVREVRSLMDAVQGMAKTLIERKHALEESNQLLEEKVAARTRELEQLKQAAEQQARTDALTGLPNRRAFNEAASALCAQASRSQRPLSLVMMDIDFFKKVNDTWGHDAGDYVLVEVAKLMMSSRRASDVAARLGGEEFAILLPDTNTEGAVAFAEKLRQNIAQHCMQYDAQVLAVTASFGIATTLDGQCDIEWLLRASDEGLYQAKTTGRNRVSVAGNARI